MSDQKSMTAYEFAFIALRLLSLYFIPHVLATLSGLTQIIWSPYDETGSELVATAILFLCLHSGLVALLWFGAGFIARLICPNRTRVDTTESAVMPAGIVAWQNLAMTLLGIYILYRALSGLPNIFVNENFDKLQRLRLAFDFVIRFGIAMFLIIAPHELTHGIKWLRANISKARVGL